MENIVISDEIIEKCKNGDEKAGALVYKKYINFIRHTANKFKNIQIDRDDLISVGNIGLVKAINNYDPSKGVKFLTFAGRVIFNEILMAIKKNKKHTHNVSLDEVINMDSNGAELTLREVVSISHDFLSDIAKDEIQIYIDEVLKATKKETHRRIIRMRLEGVKQSKIAQEFGLVQGAVSKIYLRFLQKLDQLLLIKGYTQRSYLKKPVKTLQRIEKDNPFTKTKKAREKTMNTDKPLTLKGINAPQKTNTKIEIVKSGNGADVSELKIIIESICNALDIMGIANVDFTLSIKIGQEVQP